jgi:DNA end-binding protein Ku
MIMSKTKTMRSIWKGSIGFGLVSLPVKLYSAGEKTALGLDMPDSRDHARIKFHRVNDNTKKEVPYDKIVKGCKNDDDIIEEDTDFEATAKEKSKVIEIENFVYIEPKAAKVMTYMNSMQTKKGI